MNPRQAVLISVPSAKTEWALLLDGYCFQKIANSDRAYPVNPRVLTFPIGPLGFVDLSSNSSLLPPTVRFQPAAYLIPPFVSQSSLSAGAPPPSHPSLIWSALGEHANSRHSKEAICDELSKERLATPMQMPSPLMLQMFLP
ncbi:hypothetical protein HYDPIDRAFT_25203 [Hydnomerulius pinastri MD-312]|nr:hypothetical protein HYDPIDRAFT_25203 [Hydnomerulius pinastri MD-312]